MAKVKFLLQSKSENAQIYLRLSISQKHLLKKKTGFSINPKDWGESDFPKQTKAENKALTNNLKKLEVFVLENLNKDLANGKLIDAFWIEAQINNCFNRIVKTDNNLLINHIQFIIDNANTRTKKGGEIGLDKNTVKNYKTFKKLISEYQNSIKKQIQFLEITKPFVDKFKNWLINIENYETNYAGKNLEMLKAVCRDAEKCEIATTPYSKTIEYFREQSKDRYIHTLSYKEIDQIKNLDFTKTKAIEEIKIENPELLKTLSLSAEKLNNARNWILIGCAIGQRVGDLLNITKDNVRYNKINGLMYLDIIQEKTHKEITISINEEYIIDILEKSMPTKMHEQTLNNYIKVICKLAGINDLTKGKLYDKETNRKILGIHPKYKFITSHCLRRSFVTNKNKDWNTKTIMDVTGHTKESLVYTYINEREDKDFKADLQRIEYLNQTKDKAPEMKVIKNGDVS